MQKKDSRVIVGYDNSDDAAVIRLQDDKFIIQTVDFFTPIVDDPYMFGQIAAANSISDIYAMGGKPLFALNILGFPVNDFPKDIVSKILQGGADKASEAGISIVGGHSIDDKEPKYGMAVTGEIDKNTLKNHMPLKEEKKVQVPFSEKEINLLLNGDFFKKDYDDGVGVRGRLHYVHGMFHT